MTAHELASLLDVDRQLNAGKSYMSDAANMLRQQAEYIAKLEAEIKDSKKEQL